MNIPEVNTMPSTADWHISDHAYPLFHDGGIVYLDAQGPGVWMATDRLRGAALLRACHLLDRFTLNWPELDDQPSPSETRSLLSQIANGGLISPGPGSDDYILPTAYRRNRPLLEAGNILMVRPAEDFTFSLQEITAAHTGLQHAFQITRLPLLDMVDRLNAARNTPQHIPASHDQATRIANAVRQASGAYEEAGRIACLELTVAGVLAGSMSDVHINMQLATAVDPIAPHAWLMAEGKVVRTAYDEPVANRCYPVMTI